VDVLDVLATFRKARVSRSVKISFPVSFIDPETRS
jgi:hypothetical protein